MGLTLQNRSLIERTPGLGRSIRLLLPREELPDLEEEDVRVALAYAAALARNEVHPFRGSLQ